MQILYAKDVDQRSTTFEKSIGLGKEYQRRTRMMILRAAMLKQQIYVKVLKNRENVASQTCLGVFFWKLRHVLHVQTGLKILEQVLISLLMSKHVLTRFIKLIRIETSLNLF